MDPPYHGTSQATEGKWWQRFWLVLAPFPTLSICRGLLLVAPARLHKRSISGDGIRGGFASREPAPEEPVAGDREGLRRLAAFAEQPVGARCLGRERLCAAIPCELAPLAGRPPPLRRHGRQAVRSDPGRGRTSRRSARRRAARDWLPPLAPARNDARRHA
jgi:hypothetical protein